MLQKNICKPILQKAAIFSELRGAQLVYARRAMSTEPHGGEGTRVNIHYPLLH